MKKKIQLICVSLVLLFSCLLSCFPTTFKSVYASSITINGGYTNVLEDLQKDENFNANDYVVNAEDYSLDVIQIAESSEKELFVYVYQPSAEYCNLVATSINISPSLHIKENIRNYKLTLLNSKGCFYKYIVNDFVVSEETTRYYEIISIYRAWNEKYDVSADNEQLISEVAFDVGKQYTITNLEDKVSIYVSETEIETIEITEKFVGFVRYEDGYHLYPNIGACDSHFVAFSTNKPIDKLYEADVYYVSQSYKDIWVYSVLSRETTYGDKIDNYAYLNYTQNGSCTTNGIGGQTYNWKLINSVEGFIEECNEVKTYSCGIFDVSTEIEISESALQELQSKDWVLRFTATDYNFFYTSAQQQTDKTIIGDVSILRLKFETDGVVYDLGVVDNKQTGSQDPINTTKIDLSLNETFKILVAILLLILLVVVLGPILPTLISIIFKVIKIIFKIIVWVISLPFKLLKAIFKKRK